MWRKRAKRELIGLARLHSTDQLKIGQFENYPDLGVLDIGRNYRRRDSELFLKIERARAEKLTFLGEIKRRTLWIAFLFIGPRSHSHSSASN